MASPDATLTTSNPVDHPFDTVASSYDDDFSNRWLGRWYRGMVWQLYEQSFAAGDRVLELGCGTGEDARWLAERGVEVTATDAAPAMLLEAQQKVARASLSDRVTFAPLDLNQVNTTDDLWRQLDAAHTSGQLFDGAISNFGPLNCARDRRSLIAALAGALRPGARVVVVVMGPLCPWEVVWHAARMEFRTAVRRMQNAASGRVGTGRTIPVWYPSLHRLESECRPHFTVIDRVGLGLLLPPSGMSRFADRAPRLYQRLAALDRRFSRARPWLWLNDHYALTLERRS